MRGPTIQNFTEIHSSVSETEHGDRQTYTTFLLCVQLVHFSKELGESKVSGSVFCFLRLRGIGISSCDVV